MIYDQETQSVKVNLLLKQVYYNYEYHYLPHGKNIGETNCVQGNHADTENNYQIYYYYRPPGSMYDELVGFRKISSLR